MKKIGDFDEFEVYQFDELNVYIKYKDSDIVYTILEEGKIVKISDHLKEKLFG